jgi:hypothetical protein
MATPLLPTTRLVRTLFTELRCHSSPFGADGARSESHRPNEPMKTIIGLILVLLSLTGLGPNNGTPLKPAGSARIGEAFSLMATPPTSLPRAVRLHLASLVHPRHPRTFHPRSVHLANTASGPAWIFLERDELCLSQGHQGSVACISRGIAESKGIFLGTFDPPTSATPRPHGFRIVALVPDRIRKVGVSVGGRPTLTKRVSNNLLTYSAQRPILITQFIGADG